MSEHEISDALEHLQVSSAWMGGIRRPLFQIVSVYQTSVGKRSQTDDLDTGEIAANIRDNKVNYLLSYNFDQLSDSKNVIQQDITRTNQIMEDWHHGFQKYPKTSIIFWHKKYTREKIYLRMENLLQDDVIEKRNMVITLHLRYVCECRARKWLYI